MAGELLLGCDFPDEVGVGHPLPTGVLQWVPSPAAVRRRKLSSRTYFDATLTTDTDGEVLVLAEL